MSQNWKTIRVFISSTFRDMFAERDHLVRVVFPELKERCRKKRVHLIDVDLRWGVTEKDAQEGKALDICLDEIDSCRPYFLGLLGHRYGFIPDNHHHSITAQEIYHGVLHNDLPAQIVDLRSIIEGKLEGKRLSDEQTNVLVRCYQWDADKRKYALRPDISPDEEDIIRSVFVQYSAYQRDRSFFFFRNESLTIELSGNNKDDFFDSEPQLKDKLVELKQSIVNEGLPYIEYDSIEAFGQNVLETLWKRIDAEVETEEEEKDWLKEEAEFHELFVADRTRRFVGRRNLLDKMTAFCEETSNVMVITGEPGCGKSALTGRFSEQVMHKHPDWVIIPHFAGASPSSTNLRQTLRRFCAILSQSLGITDEVPEDIKELLKLFPDLLTKAGERKKVLIIFDAVNQFEKIDNAHDMYWLPQQLPANVSFVISTLPGQASDRLLARRNKPVVEELKGLSEADIEEYVTGYLEEIKKQFPNPDVARSFFYKVKSGNPLYIQVALEELKVFGQFEKVAERVNSLPDNIPELFDQVLQRIEGDFSPALVKDCMSYIACGRYGMTAEELQTLLKGLAPKTAGVEATKLPDMLWQRLYRAFSTYLFERSGVIDFFHGQLKEAVGKRYLSEVKERDKTHTIIADYFETRWKEPYARAIDELPHQYFKGQQFTSLEKVIHNYDFLQQKIKFVGTQAIMSDFDLAMKLPEHSSSDMKTSLEMIRSSIRLSKYIIDKDSDQLVGQLYGRLQSYDLVPIRELLNRASNQQTTLWLCPRIGSLTPAKSALEQILFGHDDSVCSVAVSRDDKFMATGSADHTVRVWNLTDGICSAVLRGHTDNVQSVAISDDSSYVISGSADNTVRIWDIVDGACIAVLRGHTGSVQSVAISDNGLYVISGSADNTVRVWDIKQKLVQVILSGHSGTICSVSLIQSDNSYRVISGSDDGTIRIWPLDYELHQNDNLDCFILSGHTKGVTSVAVTKDGQYLISGSLDKTVRLWEIDSRKQLASIEGHTGGITSVASNTDARCIVSVADDGIICIWDMQSKTIRAKLNGHTERVRSVVICSDGRHIISGSDDHSIRIWDITVNSKEPTFVENMDAIIAVSVLSDNKRAIVSHRRGIIHMFDVETVNSIEDSYHINCNAYAVTVFPNNAKLVAGCDDSVIRIWTMPNKVSLFHHGLARYLANTLRKKTALTELKGHMDSITSLAISSDGRKMLSGAQDGTLRLWDMINNSLSYEFIGHKECILAVAQSPDGRSAFSVSTDCTLKIWNLEHCILQKEMRLCDGYSVAAAFSPDCRLVAMGCFDHSIRVWELEQRSPLLELTGHEGWIRAIQFNNDGRRIVSGSLDQSVRVWDVESSRSAAFSAECGISSAVWFPDGHAILAGDVSGKVHILNVIEPTHAEVERYPLDITKSQPLDNKHNIKNDSTGSSVKGKAGEDKGVLQVGDIFDFHIFPSTLGRISDAKNGSGETVFIHIADLYQHSEVQQNIFALLVEIDQNFKLKQICTERQVNFFIDSSWTDLTKQMYNQLALKMFNIGGTGPDQFYQKMQNRNIFCCMDDAETLSEVTQNYNDAQESLRKVDTKSAFNEFNLKLNQLKSEAISYEVMLFEKHVTLDKSTPNVYQRLVRYITELNVDVRFHNNIIHYLTLQRLNDSISFDTVHIQFEEFIRRLKTRITFRDYDKLYRLCTNNNELYYSYCGMLAQLYPVLADDLQNLRDYFTFRLVSHLINPVGLVNEMMRLTYVIKDRLSSSQNERDVYFMYDFAGILQKYLANQISPEDHYYIRHNMSRFRMMCRQYLNDDLLSIIEKPIESFTTYYECNRRRSMRFMRNCGVITLDEMTLLSERELVWLPHVGKISCMLKNFGEERDVVVIIAGGYHTPRIVDILKTKNLPYFVIMPNATGKD